MAKEAKTNAMRMLDRQKVKYEALAYECDEFIDGIHCADITGGADRERGGSEGRCQSCGRENRRYDPCKRYYENYRICARRMQSYWNEEAISCGF